ncbi:hypothetical protein CAPTEDRAFT_105849, partial [Capitella teleta]
QSDSGGPLVYKESDEFILTGVTSLRHSLCARTHPTPYTRIYKFRGWIKQYVKFSINHL